MNVFTLSALLTLNKDGYEQGLKSAEGSASSFGSKIGSTLGTVAKVTVASIATAVAGISALVTQSVTAYAETEQLVGGVQKLYGNMGKSLEEYASSAGKSIDEVKDEWQSLEDAQNLVLENAKNAFKETGMSANTYMETATQFSASLISSLNGDTLASAEQTQIAMQAIADNWNTFGGDLESITNAYKGFSKQNYTMLDNLKLGYGGTKAEMERLIEDANIYAESIGQASDLSIDSFSDIVTAIELIQEKQNIAGTTAREASTTIQGSLISLKASWENLVAGFADKNADIGQLITNTFSSALTFADNLLPAIAQAVTSIADAIETALPQALNSIGSIITQYAPSLVNTAVKALGTIASTIVSNLPSIISMISSALTELLPTLFESFGSGSDMTLSLVNTMFAIANDLVPTLFELAGQIIENLGNAFVENFPSFLTYVLEFFTTLSENMLENSKTLIQTACDVLLQIATAIGEQIPTLIEYIPQIITNIANIINENIPTILLTVANIFMELIVAIWEAVPTLLENLPQIFSAIVAVWEALDWLALGKDIITFAVQGVQNLFHKLPEKLVEVGNEIILKFKAINFLEIGKFIVEGIWKGISNATSWLYEKVSGWASGVLSSIKGFFGIASPSKETAWMGKMLMQGLAKGMDDNVQTAINSALSASDGILEALSTDVGLSGSYSTASINDGENGGLNDVYGTFNQVINVNQQIDTADELARAVRIESKYGLMRGVAIE